MSGAMFGGDEVGALVFDVRHDVVAAGYAGEDAPKVYLPAFVGRDADKVVDGAASVSISTGAGAGAESTAPRARYALGDTALQVPVAGRQLQSPLNEHGVVSDWELLELLLDETYQRHLYADPRHHPVLFTEPPWNPRAQRERLAELMFETYQVPAFFLNKSPALSAFANGKYSGVVLHADYAGASASPVYDGYVLQRSVRRSPTGTGYLYEQIRRLLEEEMVIDLTPRYAIQQRLVVSEDEPPKFERRPLPGLTESYKSYMKKEILVEWCRACATVHNTMFSAEAVAMLPTQPFEFPTGFTHAFGAERYRVCEALFYPQEHHIPRADEASITAGDAAESMDVDAPNLAEKAANVASAAGDVGPEDENSADLNSSWDVERPSSGLHNLLHEAIESCDVDIQPALYGSIIVTGELAGFQGLVDRLHNELYALMPPGIKLRTVVPTSAVERNYGAWIGGSILASLGSFQQLWISRQEYDEMGAGYVAKKCP